VDEEGEAAVRPYAEKQGLDFTVLTDRGGLMAGMKYEVVKNKLASVPQMFIIKKNGLIGFHHAGFKKEMTDEISKVLAELLQEQYTAEMARAESEKLKLRIIYGNSENGILQACENCPTSSMGGFDRKTAFAKNYKSEYPNVLFLESGDFFPVRKDKTADKVIIDIMDRMPLDGVTYGDQEFINGADFLYEEISVKNIPFLTANITYCNDTQCFMLGQKYKIVECGGYKVGITAVTDPGVFTFFSEEALKGLKIEEPAEILPGIISLMKKDGADITVLISHSGYDRDIELAEKITGLDLIVGGHSQTKVDKVKKTGTGTYVVQAGESGFNIGEFVLSFNEGKKIVNAENRLIPLTKAIEQDREIANIIDEYKSRMKEKLDNLQFK